MKARGAYRFRLEPTLEQEEGLPEAAFFAALTVASVARVLEIIPPKPEGLVIALVGRIPMIPGSTAAKGLIYLFKFLAAGRHEQDERKA
jgi:uncharacterized membrane protein YjjB (DUF3815 family)